MLTIDVFSVCSTMYSKVAVSLACLAAMTGTSEAIFGTLTIGTAAATAGTVGLTTGGAALLGLGAIALKGLAIAALASRGGRRGRRDAEGTPDAFTFIARAEPEECIRRLICDLATGKMPKSENDVILTLFKDDVSITDSKFEFATAAKVGQAVQDIQACEIRYSCPVSGQQLNALLN